MELGQIVVTRRIADETAKNWDFYVFVLTAVKKYMRQDWGDTCKEDWKMNDAAVESGNDRIVAKYDNIFIITEWDRSVTTILFTEEY